MKKAKKFLAAMKDSVVSFGREEEGAQVVEYALIIAVVSIVLVIALSAIGGVNMTNFIARVSSCLTTAVCV